MIYHIAEKDEWSACIKKGEYIPKRYNEDGFIHCSDDGQIEKIANLMFKGKTGILLLKIDPTKLKAKTIYESPRGTDEKFPHIYGTINKDAVVKISELACSENGEFSITAQEL
jgi:uncharacterized protein (DUF952 family)